MPFPMAIGTERNEYLITVIPRLNKPFLVGQIVVLPVMYLQVFVAVAVHTTEAVADKNLLAPFFPAGIVEFFSVNFFRNRIHIFQLIHVFNILVNIFFHTSFAICGVGHAFSK